jgi:hypothetical protein
MEHNFRKAIKRDMLIQRQGQEISQRFTCNDLRQHMKELSATPVADKKESEFNKDLLIELQFRLIDKLHTVSKYAPR